MLLRNASGSRTDGADGWGFSAYTVIAKTQAGESLMFITCFHATLDTAIC